MLISFLIGQAKRAIAIGEITNNELKPSLFQMFITENSFDIGRISNPAKAYRKEKDSLHYVGATSILKAMPIDSNWLNPTIEIEGVKVPLTSSKQITNYKGLPFSFETVDDVISLHWSKSFEIKGKESGLQEIVSLDYYSIPCQVILSAIESAQELTSEAMLTELINNVSAALPKHEAKSKATKAKIVF